MAGGGPTVLITTLRAKVPKENEVGAYDNRGYLIGILIVSFSS